MKEKVLTTNSKIAVDLPNICKMLSARILNHYGINYVIYEIKYVIYIRICIPKDY